jgi:CheY-like chemotaxis protein
MTQKRLLLLDDNLDLATVYSRMLERRGYAVTPALSVDEALGLSRLIQFDLVICDIVLTEKSGYHFLESFREISQAPALAISALTQHRDQAIAAGFANFLPKPLLIDHLISIIEETLATG